jgi:hypothetical protein
MSYGCADVTSRYWSPRSGTVRLAAANGGGYHCDEPGCMQLTTHLPTYDEFCLARVASISAYGVDPSSDKTGGTDVWAGPLSGGAYVFGEGPRPHRRPETGRAQLTKTPRLTYVPQVCSIATPKAAAIARSRQSGRWLVATWATTQSAACASSSVVRKTPSSTDKNARTLN